MGTSNARVYANLHAGAQAREYDAIAERIARDAPGRVLDWGAGFGQVTVRLMALGVPVRAYEYRAEPPGTSTFEAFPDVEFDHTDDPVRLPYASGSFDAVLSLGVLEHVSDPDGSVAEIRRVLRPGGRFYVYKLPNRLSYLEWIARRIGWYYHGSLPDDRLYTIASARALLVRHGFNVREARLTNMLPLTVGGTRPRAAAWTWSANTALSRVPLLRRLATNVELVAD